MAFEKLSGWYGQLLLPFLIAFLTGLVGAFFKWLQESYSRANALRKSELERALAIHDDIVKKYDRLFTLMRWDVWFIALRHGNSKNPNGPWNNEKRWNEYNAALDDWRMSDLLFESQVKAYFSPRRKAGGPLCTSISIRKITEKINKAAYYIWLLYWENKLYTGKEYKDISQKIEDFDTVSNNSSNWVAFQGEEGDVEISTPNNIPKVPPTFLSDDEKKAKIVYDELLTEIDEIVKAFTWTLLKSIQDENVGKIRKK